MRKKIDDVLADLLDEVPREGRERVAEKHYKNTDNPIKRVTESISAIRRGRWTLVQGDKK